VTMEQHSHFDPGLGEDFVFRSQWLDLSRRRKVQNAIFASADGGAWAILAVEEAAQLDTVALSASLFEKLEDAGLVLTASNGSRIASQVEKWSQAHYRHPVHHILVATLRCNLSCTYCHAAVVPANAGPAYDHDLETADEILRFALLSKAGAQSFEFQGGESLLNRRLLEYIIPRIRSVYEKVGKTVYISVQSNGTTLSDGIVRFLREHDVSIGTSFDGMAEIHDHNRRTNLGHATSEKVKDAIAIHKLSFLPTVTKQSVDAWQAVVDSQLANGQQVVSFQAVYPINSAATNWQDVGVEPQRFQDRYRQVVEYLKSLWRDSYYPLERRVLLAMRKLLTGREVHSQILYDTKGDIYTCDEGRDFPEFKIGNVKTSSYDEVVFGARTRQLKSLSMPNDPECISCAYRPFCSTCPVYSRAVDGKLTARHAGTDHCHHTKLIFDLVIGWLIEDRARVEAAARHHGLRI
jgi:uncharacterized protein